MKNTAVIICNFNGGMDTVKCIEAVQASCYTDYDIYMIDNASTDSSVNMVREQFKDSVTIVSNRENRGGSGGFGCGMRLAVEKGYSYIMLLDNDAYVDTDTIEKLYVYLQENPEVGIVGAKIMMSDDPERIMDYAKNIDFENFTDGSKWCEQMDSDSASLPRECDYVAATASMFRREVLLECGGMDEDFFIYYDDIELSYRVKQYGHKVVSLGSAKAWHKSSMRNKATDTFVKYYLTRNRYRFFARYMPEAYIERFCEEILRHAFTFMYGSFYKGRKDIFDTEKYILEDFIRDRRGRAGEHRVNKLQKDGYHKIEEVLCGCKHILIYPAADVSEYCILKLCEKLWVMGFGTKVTIYDAGNMEKKAKLCVQQLEERKMYHTRRNIKIFLASEMSPDTEYDKIVHFCNHVKDIQRNILPAIYIDSHDNLIANEQDYFYFRNYESSYSFFRSLYHDSVIETVYKIRKKNMVMKI